MCGICGFVGEPNPIALNAMQEVLFHRGPDAEGSFTDAQVSLGHRRLKIIDLEGGAQPLSNETDDIHLVFNGEIYNFRALRVELERLGHRFRSQSDTEVVVHAYESFGFDCLDRLEGMHAFVLYDQQKRLLFGARDRAGEKPLYYTLGGGRTPFVFASEAESLFRAPEIAGRRLSPDGVRSYLLNDYVVGRQSIYEGVERLLPGHAFVYGLPGSEREGFRSWCYWDFPIPGSGAETFSEKEAAEETLRLLSNAVESRLVADVPLGVFLSGGIDSSAIVALMTRFRAAEGYSRVYDRV